MERSEMSKKWIEYIDSCRDSLEPDDRRQVTFQNSWDIVLQEVMKGQSASSQRAGQQEFVMLRMGLGHLKNFTSFLSDLTVPSAETSTKLFWGFVVLVLKLSQEEEAAVPRVLRALRNLCRKIEIFNGFCQESSSGSTEAHQSCFEAAHAFLSFAASTIHLMRTSPQVQSLSLVPPRQDSTNPAMPSSSFIKFDEPANLPCFVFPSFRPVRFFDRRDVVSKIEEHFNMSNADVENSFRSLALYGLGGVGKSSVALRYAEASIRRGEVDAVFWAHSEKPVTIRQSFTNIAMRLKLPDSQGKDHDENRHLVLSWLQRTGCRWLIVYDNVEDEDLLLAHWPSASRGRALITTRNRRFAFNPADAGLEITTWDVDTGSKFLIHLLSTDISAQLTNDDAKSALELSEKLSGHALAISHMAGLIHRRQWSIQECMEIYNQQSGKMQGFVSNDAINSLWEYAFQSLECRSRAILGVLSFLSPDSIPQSLFAPDDAKSLPLSLEFCTDPLRYLLEINSYTDLEALIEVNFAALATLPVEDQTIGLQGSLTSHRGQLLVRLGNSSEGVQWLRKSYEIRSHAVPFNSRESAWAAENAANGIASVNDFATAIVWHEKARDHWMQWSKDNGPDPTGWPAVLKKSMGTTMIWAGKRDQARDIMTEALRQIESTEPYNWAMAA
ncbi:hypothetical protein ACHAQA_000691 [Verticillium albo-atrum]